MAAPVASALVVANVDLLAESHVNRIFSSGSKPEHVTVEAVPTTAVDGATAQTATATTVLVAVGVGTAVLVAVAVGASVLVAVAVGAGVSVAVLVGTGVLVGVTVEVGVLLGVSVGAGVFVPVGSGPSYSSACQLRSRTQSA